MKILSMTVAAFALFAIAGAQVPSFADTAGDQQIAQTKKKSMKKVVVRNRGEVKRAFGLATRPGTAAVDLTCSPASATHCIEDFATACNDADGGLSQGPDGITCSFPDAD